MKYEVILFDLDDTLIDNLENVRHAFKKMLEYVGDEYTEIKFNRWYELDKKFWIDFHDKKITVPDEFKKPQDLFVKYVRSLRYVQYFDNQITLEQAFIINELFLDGLNEVVVGIEGVYETLEYLKDKYDLVIATNGPTSAVESKLSKIDCLKFIKNIFSADMTKETITKPSVEYFEELKEYINFYDNDKLLIIGDSLKTDIKGGMNARIDACWFNRFGEILEDGYEPIMVISNLKALQKVL